MMDVFVGFLIVLATIGVFFTIIFVYTTIVNYLDCGTSSHFSDRLVDTIKQQPHTRGRRAHHSDTR